MGSLTDPDGTFANYPWAAQQVIDNLYEPYRAKYPGYISRTHQDKDQTGQFDIYGYVYTPETYKTTFLLTAGSQTCTGVFPAVCRQSGVRHGLPKLR